MRLTSEGLFIKISGVTSEEDALFSIGLGASAVGFDFAPDASTDLGERRARHRSTPSPGRAVGRGLSQRSCPSASSRSPTPLASARCRSTDRRARTR